MNTQSGAACNCSTRADGWSMQTAAWNRLMAKLPFADEIAIFTAQQLALNVRACCAGSRWGGWWMSFASMIGPESIADHDARQTGALRPGYRQSRT